MYVEFKYCVELMSQSLLPFQKFRFSTKFAKDVPKHTFWLIWSKRVCNHELPHYVLALSSFVDSPPDTVLIMENSYFVYNGHLPLVYAHEILYKFDLHFKLATIFPLSCIYFSYMYDYQTPFIFQIYVDNRAKHTKRTRSL